MLDECIERVLGDQTWLDSMLYKHADEVHWHVDFFEDQGPRPYMEDRMIAYDYVNIMLGLPVRIPSGRYRKLPLAVSTTSSFRAGWRLAPNGRPRFRAWPYLAYMTGTAATRSPSTSRCSYSSASSGRSTFRTT